MGDDFQMDTNYPIVQLTATDGSGKVYYAKTTNWTNTLIQAGATPTSAKFTLPAGLPAGTYSLRTIANGISSAPVTFDNVPLTISSTTPAANATVTTSPTSYVVQFSAAIDPHDSPSGRSYGQRHFGHGRGAERGRQDGDVYLLDQSDYCAGNPDCRDGGWRGL